MFIEVTNSDNRIIAVNVENILYIENRPEKIYKCTIYLNNTGVCVKDEYDIVLSRIKEALRY